MHKLYTRLDKQKEKRYILAMAELNLLKSGYQGKLGETNGYEHKGKFIVRATPFSRSPLNKQQKDNFNAFAKLNRVASFWAKNCFESLNIKKYTAYKHNAVASYLKTALNNGDFELDKISEIDPFVQSSGEMSMVLHPTSDNISCTSDIRILINPPTQFNHYLMVFLPNYKGFVFTTGNNRELTIEIPSLQPLTESLTMVSFLTFFENGQYKRTKFWVTKENVNW